MLGDITLGQYYQEESPIHRLDPRVKLFGTILYMVSLFIFNNLYCYALSFVFLAVVILLTAVPVGYMLKGIRGVLILMLITVICNLFFTPGEPVFEFWFVKIAREGIVSAVYMMIRLTLLVVSASIMTLTTTPNQMTDGLEKMFRPLRVFKVPVHEIAMMMSIALRFIPILMEETDKIVKAQTARGARFDSKNIFVKIKSLVPLLVPLFVSAFRRAYDLALAMEARCYHGGDGRTKMKPLKYRGRDFLAFLLLILYLAGTVVLGILYHKGVLYVIF